MPGACSGAKGWSSPRALEHEEPRPRPALTPALPTAPWRVGIREAVALKLGQEAATALEAGPGHRRGMRLTPSGQSPGRTGKAWASQRAEAGLKGRPAHSANPKEGDLTLSFPMTWLWLLLVARLILLPERVVGLSGIKDLSWFLSGMGLTLSPGFLRRVPSGWGAECLGARLITRALALRGVSGSVGPLMPP